MNEGVRVSYRQSQSFSLPTPIMEQIRRLAELRGESMSFVVREALRCYLAAHLPIEEERSKERHEQGLE